MSRREPYRPDQAVALSRIEARRQALAITHAELQVAAGLSRSTYQRIRAAGRASAAQVKALRFALRTIERRRQSMARLDGEAGDE